MKAIDFAFVPIRRDLLSCASTSMHCAFPASIPSSLPSCRAYNSGQYETMFKVSYDINSLVSSELV